MNSLKNLSKRKIAGDNYYNNNVLGGEHNNLFLAYGNIREIKSII